MTETYKTVEIIKTVPVANKETLTAWLNAELADWLEGLNKRDGGISRLTVGSKAIELIHEAGFTLNAPRVNREGSM